MAEEAKEQTDEQLIARVALGDKRAFDLLWERHYGRLLRLVLRMIGDGAEAEDILQDTFMAAYRTAGSFDPTMGVPFSSYLDLIAARKALDRIRRIRTWRNWWRRAMGMPVSTIDEPLPEPDSDLMQPEQDKEEESERKTDAQIAQELQNEEQFKDLKRKPKEANSVTQCRNRALRKLKRNLPVGMRMGEIPIIALKGALGELKPVERYVVQRYYGFGRDVR